jgi:hypothetical protein
LSLSQPGIGLRLETQYPFADEIALTITQSTAPKVTAISLRIPSWCESPRVSVNGRALRPRVADGYVRLRQTWKKGDVIRLNLPRELRIEPTPDDPNTVALMLGPLLLAGDLGPATERWEGLAPVLVGADLPHGIAPTAEAAVYRTQGVARPADLTLRPFAFQHDNNTAVYFRRFTEAAWRQEQVKFQAEQAQLRDLDARSADVVRLGDASAEHEHSLESKFSYPVVYRGRPGRDARTGGFFECTVKTRQGSLTLQATYWGEERDRRFTILVDGVALASEHLDGSGPSDFLERNYAIPEALTQGKPTLRVRFEPEKGFSAGPAFGLRLYAAGAISA